MKRLLSTCLCLALAACTTAGGSSRQQPPVITNPQRHLLTAIVVADDLAGVSSPQIFETALCSKLFEYNQKQVSCADELRVLLESQRERAVLGDPTAVDLENLMQSQRFQRRVSLSAAKIGESVVISVLVQNPRAEALGRFQVPLAADGSDVVERATDAAIQILKLP